MFLPSQQKGDDVKDVLMNLIVVIPSQYTHVSNHHIVYLKFNRTL